MLRLIADLEISCWKQVANLIPGLQCLTKLSFVSHCGRDHHLPHPPQFFHSPPPRFQRCLALRHQYG